MNREKSRYAALGYAVAGLRDQLLLAVFGLVGYLVGLGKGGSQMVSRANLQRPAIGHDHIDGSGVIRAGELVPAGPAAHQKWQSKAAIELRVPLDCDLHLLCSILPGGMNRMGLLEGCDLPQANEGSGVLGLIAECVDYLVNAQRQVGMGPDPELEHRIDGSLAGGTQCQIDLKRSGAASGHPVDLILEALDMLSFFHELVFRYQKGKLSLLMVGIEKLPDDGVDVLSYAKTEGEPDAHSLDGISVIYDLCRHEKLMIPLAVVALGRQLGLLDVFCIGFCLGISHVTTDITNGVINVSMIAAKKSRGATQRTSK